MPKRSRHAERPELFNAIKGRFVANDTASI
jgi:hypothetical protein